MTHRTTLSSYRSFLCLLLVLVAAMLAPTGATASDRFTKSKEAAFPGPQPGMAVLYVLREPRRILTPQPSFELYVDEEPIGHLPQRAYLAAQVAPGYRLLWGPPESVPRWFELEAGKTYVVKLIEHWVPRTMGTTTTTVLASVEWDPDDPAFLERNVREGKLAFVVPSEKGIAELKEEVREKYPKARARAAIRPGDVGVGSEGKTPPLAFEKVWYRTEKRGLTDLPFAARGRLRFTNESIELVSGEETIRVPAAEIEAVSTGFMQGDSSNRWVRVSYGPPGSLQVVGFTCPPFALPKNCEHTSLYRRIKNTSESAHGAQETESLPPVEEAERVVAGAEAFMASGAMNAPDLQGALAAQGEADRRRGELSRVDALLSGHLSGEPDDLNALFLQVRLDRVYSLLSPVTLVAGATEATRTAGAVPGRDPQATLDRILDLSPGHPLAYMMKALLYSVFDPMKDGPLDPEKAIHFAGLAVQAAPEHAPFRETLALLLADGGDDRGALGVLEAAPDELSSLRRLVTDRVELPVPDGAVQHQRGIRYFAQQEAAAGRLVDWPYLRVAAFDLRQAAPEVETHYRQRWKDFRLYTMDRDKIEGGGSTRTYAALLDWNDAGIALHPGKPDRKMRPEPDTVLLILFESEGPPPRDGTDASRESGTQLLFVNYREVPRLDS